MTTFFRPQLLKFAFELKLFKLLLHFQMICNVRIQAAPLVTFVRRSYAIPKRVQDIGNVVRNSIQVFVYSASPPALATRTFPTPIYQSVGANPVVESIISHVVCWLSVRGTLGDSPIGRHKSVRSQFSVIWALAWC